MSEVPAIESIISAEELEAAKANMRKIVVESYQPVLDGLIERFSPGLKAVVTAAVEIILEVEADGAPVLRNNISLGMEFSPKVTHDPFEEAQRIIVSTMFNELLNSKK